MRSTRGRDVRTMRSSHQTWSWPHASYGASGRPFSSRGAGPTNCSRPGFVSVATAPCRPSRASFSASPLRGPKPARQSSRSASAAPNFPRYAASCGKPLSPSIGRSPDGVYPRMRERPRIREAFPLSLRSSRYSDSVLPEPTVSSDGTLPMPVSRIASVAGVVTPPAAPIDVPVRLVPVRALLACVAGGAAVPVVVELDPPVRRVLLFRLVVARALVRPEERAALLRAGLRRAAGLRAGLRRAAGLRAGLRLAAGLRAAGFRRAAGLRAGLRRAAGLRAAGFRRAAGLRLAAGFRAAGFR